MKHTKLNMLALLCITSIRLQINPYLEPTSYYENGSLCKHGKIDVRHFGLTYFRLVSDVTLLTLKNSNLRPSILSLLIWVLITFNFHKIQKWRKK